MVSTPTIGEFYKAKAVTDEAIDKAVDAFLAGKAKGPAELGEGIVIDVAAAVEAHKPAAAAVADPERSKFARGMVRTAIILARAEKA